MSPLSRLNKYFLKYKLRLSIGIVFVAVSNIFGIMPAKLVREAIDSASEQIALYKQVAGMSPAPILYDIISKNLLVFAGLVLLMALLKGVFMFMMRQTIIIVSRYIEYDLKNEIYHHYQQLDFNFYNRNSTGDLMNRISEDVSRVRMYIGPAIMYTVNLVVLFVLVIYAMVQVDLKLTLITLIPLPLLSILIYKVENVINRKSEVVQRKLSGLSSLAQESFSGIRVLKGYAMERAVGNRFAALSEEYARDSVGLARVNAIFMPALLLLVGCSTVLTVYFGGIDIMAGKLTMGNVAEFIIYVSMLTWPVASLGWVVSLVQRASASQQRINEFLVTKPAVANGSFTSEKFEGDIVLESVSYTYPGMDKKVLKDISLHIPAGKSAAITGRTGSGKSTLAGLLTRQFDPDSGTILLDGVSLNEYNTGFLNSHMALVPQESFLFSDTIGNNIAFGAPKLHRGSESMAAAIRDAAAKAEVLENIEGFPKGMQTKVGERGITLSGGQKQRLCIARALLHQPDLLLLDDSLSAVDTSTEEAIIRNIRNTMKGKTTIWISHRISSISHADLIFVLDDGHLVAAGSHQELLRQGGLYATLYHQQALQAELSVS